ncbi:MAG: antibiotic biosynthesis monooxygenase [Chloroflexota bacterium]|nr:antibiotic biosynthesis monooxygenase [Chloroflexota bacterium]
MASKETIASRPGKTKGFRPRILKFAVFAAAAGAAYLYSRDRRAGTAWDRSRRMMGAEDSQAHDDPSAARQTGTNLHARVGLYQVKPGTLDESLEKAYNELLPRMQKQPGLAQYTVMTTGPDSFVSLNVWETRAQAEKAAAMLSGWAEENMENTVVRMEGHIGEVILQRGQSSPDTPPRYGMIRMQSLKSAPPDLTEKVRVAYLPQMERQPGFNEFVAVCIDDGNVITYTSYDFKVDAERAAANLEPWVEEHIAPHASHVERHAGVITWAVRKR